MGCTASRLEQDEELPAGLRPIRRKMVEVKRRRQRRRFGTISTTQLLSPENPDDDDKKSEREGSVSATSSSSSGRRKKKVAPVPEEDEEEKDGSLALRKQEEKGKAGADAASEEGAAAALEGWKKAAAEHDEKKEPVEQEKEPGLCDIPRSPSFRCYMTDTDQARDSDDDSVKFSKLKRNEKLPEIKENENPHGSEESHESLYDSVNSNEDVEHKPIKKEKRKMVKKLTKGPSSVYNMFHVSSCYCSPASTAAANDSPRLLVGRAA